MSKSPCWGPNVWNPLKEADSEEGENDINVIEEMHLIQIFNAEERKIHY